MMKLGLLMLCSLILSTPHIANAVEFSSDIESQPLRVEIVSWVTSNNKFEGRDRYGATRIRVWRQSTVPEVTGRYTYLTSSGYQGTARDLNGNETEGLIQHLQSANNGCAVTLYIDRTTLTLLKSHASCDPLAALPIEDNAG